MPGYAHHYQPASLGVSMLKIISELFDEKGVGMTSEDVKNHCDVIFDTIEVTPSQASLVEERTRGQACNKDWYRFRTGRITASRLYAVSHTSLDKQSQSLLKAVCYPHSLRAKPLTGVVNMRRPPLMLTSKKTKIDHANMESSLCGLTISCEYPFLGATPDMVIACDCCGKGCVEVKCPYCARENFSDLKKDFCLEKFGEGLRLKRTHPYHSQIQAQIFVFDKMFCDFVVWTPNTIHIERVLPDVCFWNDARGKAEKFFRGAILPELVGKKFSQPAVLTSLQTTESNTTATSSAPVYSNLEPPVDSNPEHSRSVYSDSETICICREPYDNTEDRVIGCDNQNCPYVWLHFKCIKMKRAPKQSATWYCPDCRKLTGFSKKVVQNC